MIIRHIPDTSIPGSQQSLAPAGNNAARPPAGKETGRSTASPRRWFKGLLSLPGVLLPVVAGVLVSWPWERGEMFDAVWVLGTAALGIVLSVAIGACLLRSQWALIIAPLAWIGGELLGAVLIPLLRGGWPALQAEQHFWQIQGTTLAIVFSPLVLCAALGVGGWLRETVRGTPPR